MTKKMNKIEDAGLNGLVSFYMEPKTGQVEKVASKKGNQYWELVSFDQNDVAYQEIESNYNELMVFADKIGKNVDPDHGDKYWKLISFDKETQEFKEEATTKKHELAYFASILEKNLEKDRSNKIWGLISYSE